MAQERHGKGDRPSTEEVRELRKATAQLMAPFMFQTLELARQFAEETGIHDPAARYGHLAAVTLDFLRHPESRDTYMASYPHFAAYFRNRDHYANVYDQHFSGLMVPAIQDAYKVGCGAARFLEEQGRGQEASNIIPRSTGLLAIARVSKAGALKIDATLGRPVESQYFCWGVVDAQDVVALTPEAQAVIDKYPSPYGGCAAYAVEDPRPGSTAPDLLTAYWEAISTYAFPGDAVSPLDPVPQL